MSSTTARKRPHIKFSEDWDKLSRPRFTTIRSYRLEKEKFYRAHLGETFTILRVKNAWSTVGRKVGEATLLSARQVAVSMIPIETLVRDVEQRGKINEEWMRRILRMETALLLEFENHTRLLA